MNRLELLAKNSTANMLRSASTSALQVLLPIVLLRVVDATVYSFWAIIFALCAFIPLLDLGLQSTIQALVGRFNSMGKSNASVAVLRISLKFGCAICLGCLLVFAGIGYNAGSLFPSIVESKIPDFAIVMLILAAGQCAMFLSNLISSYYAGLQRTIEPVLVIALSRIASLILTILLGLRSDIIFMAIGYSCPLLIGLVLLFFRGRNDWRMTTPPEKNEISARLVVAYSLPLALWSVSSVAVGGIGAFVVARVSFESVAVYSVVAALISAVAGIQSSILGPLIPELSQRSARGSNVSTIVTTAVRLNSAYVFLLASVLAAIIPVLVGLLMGRSTVPVDGFAWPLLVMMAAAVRLVGTPMTMLFISTGLHRRLFLPPFLDASMTVCLTWVLGNGFGVVGVSVGLLLGAILGVVVTFSWSLRVAAYANMSARAVLRQMLFVPLMFWLPMNFLNVLGTLTRVDARVMCASLLLSAVPTTYCVWRWGVGAAGRAVFVSIATLALARVVSAFRLPTVRRGFDE